MPCITHQRDPYGSRITRSITRSCRITPHHLSSSGAFNQDVLPNKLRKMDRKRKNDCATYERRLPIDMIARLKRGSCYLYDRGTPCQFVEITTASHSLIPILFVKTVHHSAKLVRHTEDRGGLMRLLQLEWNERDEELRR